MLIVLLPGLEFIGVIKNSNSESHCTCIAGYMGVNISWKVKTVKAVKESFVIKLLPSFVILEELGEMQEILLVW